jgi:alpha,alpha-trehalose phosphorylase
VRGRSVTVRAGKPVSVPLDGQGPEIKGIPTLQTGERRPDGTLITASVPQAATRR